MLKKSILIGLVSALTLGAAATAESYFFFLNELPNEALLDLGLVTSDGAGVVEIYDYRLGQQGELLGSVDVNAGANPDLRLDIGMPPSGDMLALLRVNGEVVATNVYDVSSE